MGMPEGVSNGLSVDTALIFRSILIVMSLLACLLVRT